MPTNATKPSEMFTTCKGCHFIHRILKIEMDVHSTNDPLGTVESRFGENDRLLVYIRVGPIIRKKPS